MTTISDQQAYEEALERLNTLRAQGTRASSGTELLELEAAVHAYAQRADTAAVSKGKPTPDPYADQPDQSRTPRGAGGDRSR